MWYLRRQQRLIIGDIIIAALSTRLFIIICRVYYGRRIYWYRLKVAWVIRYIIIILKLLRSLNLIIIWNIVLRFLRSYRFIAQLLDVSNSCLGHLLWILHLLLVYIVMKSGNQSIMIDQCLSLLFIYILTILRGCLAKYYTILLIHILALVRIRQRFIYCLLILLLYQGCAATIERFQRAFSAWIYILILVTKALNKTFARKVIIKVAMGHQSTTINSNSLITNLAYGIVIGTFSSHYLLTLNCMEIASSSSYGIFII